MDNDLIYQNFIEALKQKVPGRGKLANVLADMLCLEKEAVYRRIRCEVPFTFSETAVIAKELDVSLDNIVGTTSSKTRPFQMRMIDFENPKETDYVMQEHYGDMLDIVGDDPGSESGMAGNVIPINLCMPYNYIYRFLRLKWLYQFGSRPKKMKEIILAERLLRMNEKSVRNAKLVANTYYIWDEQIIPSFIKDIQYFANIRLIEPEEVLALKEELFDLLGYLESLAINGEYETGKKVFIFLSSLNFETSYSYIETREYCLSIIRSFALNDTTSLDIQVFEKIKTWMQSLIRTSTLISGSNEILRIQFFDKQREYVEAL